MPLEQQEREESGSEGSQEVADTEADLEQAMGNNDPSLSDERKQEIQALVQSDKTIYSLKELKRIKKLFFMERRHIEVGYRAHPKMTVGMCTRSICQLHNETMNIYTHMLPAFYILF